MKVIQRNKNTNKMVHCYRHEHEKFNEQKINMDTKHKFKLAYSNFYHHYNRRIRRTLLSIINLKTIYLALIWKLTTLNNYFENTSIYCNEGKYFKRILSDSCLKTIAFVIIRRFTLQIYQFQIKKNQMSTFYCKIF